jgi:hypothetical protein
MAQHNVRNAFASYAMPWPHFVSRIRFKLGHLMLLLAPIAVAFCLAAWFAQALSQAISETQQSVCTGGLFYLGAHLANYRDRHGHFPPVCTHDALGRPMHSWRAILYAEMDADFRQAYDFNEPWDSQKNIRWAERPPKSFTCPNNQSEPPRFANFVALVDRAEGDPNYIHAHGQIPPLGQGLLLIEYPDSQILWTDPRDVYIEQLSSLGRGVDPAGIGTLLTDRTVRRQPINDVIRALGNETRTGNEKRTHLVNPLESTSVTSLRRARMFWMIYAA